MNQNKDQNHNPDRVVVGAEDSPVGLHAVRVAARAAARCGVALEIVHVEPAYLPTGPLPMVPDGAMQAYGRQVLERARTAAGEVAPEIEVATTLATGGRVDAIVTRAGDAALLVLGAQHRHFRERLLTGTVVTGVAARSTCPVLVVSGEQEPEVTRGQVVVGLKSPERSETLVSAGFALARERHARLVLVHAWHLETGYDDIVANRTDRQQWTDDLTTLIEHSIEDHRRQYPDVEVRIDVVHGQAAYALVDIAARSDVLLISRPAHGGFFHHLGSTARAVLREARCTVEVVPPRRTDRGTVTEAAGDAALSR